MSLSTIPRETKRNVAALEMVAAWLESHPDHPMDDLPAAVECVTGYDDALARVREHREREIKDHAERVAKAAKEGWVRPDDPYLPSEMEMRIWAAADVLQISRDAASDLLRPLVRPRFSPHAIRGMRAAKTVATGATAAAAVRIFAETGRHGWTLAIEAQIASETAAKDATAS